MRKVILIAAVLLFACQTAVPITLQRNNIFELTSLAYLVSFDTGKGRDLSKKRMSAVEALGYRIITNEDFRARVEEHFKPFAGHEFVEYVRGLEKNEEGVALTTMFEVADALTVKDGEIVLNPGVDVDKVTDSEYFRNKEELEKYVRLLNDFYKDTDFEDFVKENSVYYDGCGVLFNARIMNSNLDYFESFLLDGGKLDFIPLYSLGYEGTWVLGNWNDGEIKVVKCFKCVDCDLAELSKPYPQKSFLEFMCGNYANEFYDTHKESLEKASIKLYDKFKVEHSDNLIYHSPQEMTKDWLELLYAVDYSRKTKMTEWESHFINFGSRRISWFKSSVSEILKDDDNIENMNHRIVSFYNDLADKL